MGAVRITEMTAGIVIKFKRRGKYISLDLVAVKVIIATLFCETQKDPIRILLAP
jgi:hypothetical protein